MAAAEVTVLESSLESAKVKEVRTELLPVAMETDEKDDSEDSTAVVDDGIPQGDEDDNMNDELTPPPDTPADASEDGPVEIAAAVEENRPNAATMSTGEPMVDPPKASPSPPMNSLEDEIVVGTNARTKRILKRAESEDEDIEMGEVERRPDAGQHPIKRKRVSVTDAASVAPESPPYQEVPEARPDVRRRATRPKTHGMAAVKGVPLGYWRISEVEDPRRKHGVIGFIDVRDRLRTRVQQTTRDGEFITHEYPLPPGPGGSWVTFENIVFEPHLVNLDHNQIKEYVKIRAQTFLPTETKEETARLDAEAVKQAIQNVEDNPPPETSAPVQIAYGPDIPEHVTASTRPSKKRRAASPGSAASSPAPSAIPPATRQEVFDSPSDQRTTRAMIGYWKDSTAPNEADKHAVYGIIGANDVFRLKLMKETRDGRPAEGNFPTGPGALWLTWDDCVFEPHLQSLSRMEMKEYCRVRQRQINQGEAPEDRTVNEIKAIGIAMQVAAGYPTKAQGTPAPTRGALAQRREDTAYSPSPLGRNDSPVATRHNGPESTTAGAHLAANNEQRQTRRNEDRGRPRLPPAEFREANRPRPAIGPVERTQALARRELERAENAQNRIEQFAAEREGAGPSTGRGRAAFQDDVSRLNDVWAAQEAARLRAGGAEDAKMYGGIKYERKSSGPFAGRYVAPGAIITIDGEDYVEYRVLTKPTFF
ncbi:hypothetical protein V8F20_000205 [Naviculisporaceae sp. PSN 640]